MNAFFTVGAVAGWLLVSLISGKLQPVFSLTTILAVVIGGILGVILLPAVVGKK